MEKKKLWTALSVLALAMMPIAGNADDLHSEAVDRASVAPVSSAMSVSALAGC